MICQSIGETDDSHYHGVGAIAIECDTVERLAVQRCNGLFGSKRGFTSTWERGTAPPPLHGPTYLRF